MSLRVILGTHPTNGQTALWISKPGADATSSNKEDFLFDPSRYPMRLYMGGAITRLAYASEGPSGRAQSGTYPYAYLDYNYYSMYVTMPSITHNLGYVPAFAMSGNPNYNINTSSISAVSSVVGPTTYKWVYVAGALNGTTVYINNYDPATRTIDAGGLQLNYAIYRNRWL
jgi:hypothetical protein